jgi:hypothetical protein
MGVGGERARDDSRVLGAVYLWVPHGLDVRGWQMVAAIVHWQDSDGKWWHVIDQRGKGHPADPAHAFDAVLMDCNCPAAPPLEPKEPRREP